MLQSMTGFGQVQRETGELHITVELKTLNSRNFDINFRLPRALGYKEPALRTHLYNKLSRGKVFLSVDIQYIVTDKLKRNINHDLIKRYHEELSRTADELNLGQEGLLSTLLNFPEVVESNEEADQEAQWESVLPAIDEAIEQLKAFRQDEGNQLHSQLKAYGEAIMAEKKAIAGQKDERLKQAREKLYDNLEGLLENTDIQLDKNRFEQEVLYYLEKMDITEELDRLDSHLEYYFQNLNSAEAGRRLNFITQEIGREVNTIGSKVNDSAMQQQVVTMKENLEKIKEQLQNIL